MIKKVFKVDIEDDRVRETLTQISEMFPCFIWEEKSGEITIEARAEDMQIIEIKLDLSVLDN